MDDFLSDVFETLWLVHIMVYMLHAKSVGIIFVDDFLSDIFDLFTSWFMFQSKSHSFLCFFVDDFLGDIFETLWFVHIMVYVSV